MSLRTRLLLALGVVALVALVVADVVTYSSLRSFLVQRVDEQLQQADAGLVAGLGPGPDGPPHPPRFGDQDRNRALPGGYLEVRDSHDVITNNPTPAQIGPYKTATPKLPKRITGLTQSGEGE